MNKFVQINDKLKKEVSQIKKDKDVTDLGFKCRGKLCECDGYENFNERLWVWVKVENNEIYIVVTKDNSNCYCKLIYTDMYIDEIINKLI